MNGRYLPGPHELGWPTSNCAMPPGPGRVQLWCAPLWDEAAVPADLSRCLSEPEIRRSARFQSADLRRRFILSRLVLRRVLGTWAGCDPMQLCFDAEPNGKPVLIGHPELQFNLSHSGDLLLLALALDHPIGVDLEQIRPLRDPHGLAKRFFSPDEVERLRQTDSDRLPVEFFRLWTRKEATLKATGEGISSGLDTFTVVDSEGRFEPIVQRRPDGTSDWSLIELAPAPGFVGALARPASESGWPIDKNVFVMRPEAAEQTRSAD